MFQATKFIQETIKRLKTKSPKYFMYVQILFGALCLLGSLPSFLHEYFDISMGTKWESMLLKVSAWALGVVSGSVLTADDTKQMPISGQDDKKDS